MGNTTRSTRAAVSRVEFDALKGDVSKILTILTGEAPEAPKATRVRKARKASKKTTSAKASTKATASVFLTKASRPAFVKQNPEFAGKTTLQIAEALVAGASFKGAWSVGERTMVRVTTGAYPTTKATEATGKKATKKARKSATKVTAEVKAEAPAKVEHEYGSPEWYANTRPVDKDTPRRADGKPTPKSEWPLRIALEASGKFDRHEVDAVVRGS